LLSQNEKNYFDMRNGNAVNTSFENIKGISDGVLVSSDFLRSKGCWRHVAESRLS
jgi:hypothetical protein